MIKLKPELDPYVQKPTRRDDIEVKSYDAIERLQGRIGIIAINKLRPVPVGIRDDQLLEQAQEQLREMVGIVYRSDSISVDKEDAVSFFLKYMTILTIRGTDELLLFDWQQGIYVDGRQRLERIMANLFNYLAGDVWSHGLEEGVLQLLMRRAPVVDRDALNKQVFTFNSCVLRLDNLQFVKPDPKFLSTIKSPITPMDMPTPYWDGFMATTFDNSQDVAFVTEWLGYLFDTSTKGESVLFMQSSGSSGKSTLTQVMREIVGVENASALSLQQLGVGFATSDLLGKVALLTDESSDGKFNVALVKAISSGAPVHVDVKYKDGQSVVLPVKMSFAFNILPEPEATFGFERRLLLLKFPHQFDKDTQDKHLIDNLRGELPGIAWKGVNGLRELRKNGYEFVESPAMITAKKRYITTTRPVVADFIHDRLQASVGARTDKKVILEAFKQWAVDEQRPTGGFDSPGRFWKEFRALVFGTLGVQYHDQKSNALYTISDVTLID